MKKKIVQSCLFFIVVYSCRKDTGIETPPVNQPQETIAIKLQAIVTIGNINYDSIPAMFRIISWDENNVVYNKDTLLRAGKNSIILPKAHTRFQFILNKWGITDTITLTRQQLQTDVVYTLGGTKAVKKLLREERYTSHASNGYTPSGKTIYSYNNNGLTFVDRYEKLPSNSDIQLTEKHRYQYNGNVVSRIDVLDENNIVTGFTSFDYNAQLTRIVNMHKAGNSGETFAAIEYNFPTGHALITIDYLYSNGNAMEYIMKIRGGNNVADTATSSHSGIERGEYKYDFNINPYAHMNMPDLFLSNLSKNNLIDQQKVYIGSVPDNEPYKFEYAYDDEGYPVELVKHFRSYKTGAHLFKIKTLFFY